MTIKSNGCNEDGWDLFEDWYITNRSGPDIDIHEDLKLDKDGEYYYQETYWMHRAFLAGQVLGDGNDNPTIPN